MNDYASFLAGKRIEARPVGFDPVRPMSAKLFPFQAECVRRALVRGRSAMFESCGLGKTIQELEWADHVAAHAGRPVLVLTPNGVVDQYEREAEAFGYGGVKAVGKMSDVGQARIAVTNYEKLHLFRPEGFGGIVIDESSILKSFDGKVRKQITGFAKSIPFRLAASATPAPNDLIELASHAEFLDVMTTKEIIACFFTQDGNTTQKWRLKKHATVAFWRWLSTWCTAIRKPSDLGFPDDGFVLPPLEMYEHISASEPPPGWFLPVEAATLSERRAARKDSQGDRVRGVLGLIDAEPDRQWLIWCDYNYEQDAVKAALGDRCVSIQGTTPDDHRVEFERAWRCGRVQHLLTKPSLFGYGMNWQHCSRMVFAGISDSFEQQFQAIRRCWRFGQPEAVHVHLLASEAEGAVLTNLARKQKQADEMFGELVVHMAGFDARRTFRDVDAYEPAVTMRLPDWLRSEAVA